MIDSRETVPLDYKQFNDYEEISLYTLYEKHIFEDDTLKEKRKLIKDAVEKWEAAEVVVNDVEVAERRQELSSYGSMGKEASQRSSKKFTHRPKKTQPQQKQFNS
jgi:hypothetical protein